MIPQMKIIMQRKKLQIDNADNLGIVMLMYNYSMILGIFWNYYRDENDDVDVNDNVSDGKLLEYETKIVGETP